ncbi:MAG: hypothetical protein ACLQPH_19730 [Acidimicrobiales bacterium]
MVAGMVAGMAMAMFAMVASVTYQHHGFFTPLFHISALLGSPDAMMTSVSQAMAGDHFWFAASPAFLGLMIHMVTGAAYGMVFVLITQRLRRSLVIPAGMAYGLAVFVVSSFIGLPIAAKLTAARPVITNMAKIVGWSTFAVEHLMFGTVLGLLTFALNRSGSPEARVELRLAVTV